jgi:hypothetical protein
MKGSNWYIAVIIAFYASYHLLNDIKYKKFRLSFRITASILNITSIMATCIAIFAQVNLELPVLFVKYFSFITFYFMLPIFFISFSIFLLDCIKNGNLTRKRIIFMWLMLILCIPLFSVFLYMMWESKFGLEWIMINYKIIRV